MISGNSFQKRVRRRVTGREQIFFAATAPGLEDLCRKEFLALSFPEKSLSVSEGGVTFSGRVHDCYIANLHLRTANRILMRIEAFKATNFRMLKRKLADFPWELYLQPHHPHELSVSARQSRLYHTEAVAEQFKANIMGRLGNSFQDVQDDRKAGWSQKIFVRVAGDGVTVSLDSTGEHLYKRGIKTQGGKAPVRETIAAAVLQLAGYDGKEPLVDPMCGSGTFSMEGALMANHIPAGWFRQFAFEAWPFFLPERWKHIRREAEKDFCRPEKPVIFSSDQDLEVCRMLNSLIKKNELSDTVQVFHRNFFDISVSDLSNMIGKGRKGIVVINPPYGLRLGTLKESETLFTEICVKLSRDFKGWKLALIVPRRRLLRKIPFQVEKYPVFHGGLNLTLAAGMIR
jgi:putative N6-adenine-specific DNA methylase